MHKEDPSSSNPPGTSCRLKPEELKQKRPRKRIVFESESDDAEPNRERGKPLRNEAPSSQSSIHMDTLEINSSGESEDEVNHEYGITESDPDYNSDETFAKSQEN